MMEGAEHPPALGTTGKKRIPWGVVVPLAALEDQMPYTACDHCQRFYAVDRPVAAGARAASARCPLCGAPMRPADRREALHSLKGRPCALPSPAAPPESRPNSPVRGP